MFGQWDVVGGILAVVLFFLFIGLLKALIRVCPPNQVLVISGRRTHVQGRDYGFRIQRAGRTLVIPYFESCQALELSIIPINVRVEGVNAANGITVGADATACVCVDDDVDETLLYTAVERLMGKSRAEIQEQIHQTMVGNMRGALNRTTPLQAIGMVESTTEGESHTTPVAIDEGERAKFRLELLKDSNQDLSAFGMKVVSVSLQRIWDTSNYIANLANKTLSRRRQDVEIEVARLRARAERAESDAQRREIIAENTANEQIVAAQQELEILRRQFDAQIEQTRLEADSAVAQAKSEGERTVQEINIDLQRLKNLSNVTLEAGARLQAAEIRAQGVNAAVQTLQETQNDLLRQKAELVANSGDMGKTILFVQQQLAPLFAAYREHAKGLALDGVIIMDDERGINGVVNRGPEAFVAFLQRFEEAFGIRVRDLLSVAPTKGKEARA